MDNEWDRGCWTWDCREGRFVMSVRGAVSESDPIGQLERFFDEERVMCEAGFPRRQKARYGVAFIARHSLVVVPNMPDRQFTLISPDSSSVSELRFLGRLVCKVKRVPGCVAPPYQ